MNGKRSTILYLHQRAPDAALGALNRLTGLRFTHWPESLVDRSRTQLSPIPDVSGAPLIEPQKVSG